MAPEGAIPAEQFVREQFVRELQEYRGRRNQVACALAVMIDGDNAGVGQRRATLDDACREAGIEPRQNGESVAVFVPTWNIETWIAYLNGGNVDEGRRNYPRLARERECRAQVNNLVGMRRQHDLRPPAPRGRLVLAEFKLWRNPQARREVIGQILDYAKELASWGYEDLQREISKTLRKPGNVLYDLVRAGGAEIDEAEFADDVARCLRRGEFLLLIVGDGIREDTARIVDFVQRHAGLCFNLALVEAAIYRGGDGGLLVQPRVLAKTVLLRRTIIESAAPEPERGADAPLSDEERENLRFWTSVMRGFVFSDVTVEPPAPAGEPSLFVRVRNSGYGDRGLWFGVRARRRQRDLDCYLTRRNDLALASRVYEELAADGSIAGLRAELGDSLELWSDGNNPRLGFRRAFDPACLSPGGDPGAYADAVVWVRETLDRLASSLHPRLQRLLADAP